MEASTRNGSNVLDAEASTVHDIKRAIRITTTGILMRDALQVRGMGGSEPLTSLALAPAQVLGGAEANNGAGNPVYLRDGSIVVGTEDTFNSVFLDQQAPLDSLVTGGFSMSETSGERMLLKIGELAKRTGVTIRALRHYDEIGLLSPSTRSEGGFRLYSLEDVGKLYRIQALCRLNLPLAEVQAILNTGNATFPDILGKQIAFLNHQISHAVALRDHVVELQSRLDQSTVLTMDDWVDALAQMSAVSKYFNDDERRALAQRASIKETCDKEKAALTVALQKLMAQGVKADTSEAQELAYRWIQLLMAEVGGNEGLLMKYYTMQWNEDSLQLVSGIDQAGMTYISHAMAYRRLEIYARYCSSDEIRSLRRHYVRHTTSWPPLIAAIRSHMAIGTDPEDMDMHRLAREWTALESKKVGGDRALAAKLQEVFINEPTLRFGSGIDEPFLAYLDKAIQAPCNNPLKTKIKGST